QRGRATPVARLRRRAGGRAAALRSAAPRRGSLGGPDATRSRAMNTAATRPVRIANCSGFYGDRIAAAKEMVDGGPIDVLTGDDLVDRLDELTAAGVDLAHLDTGRPLAESDRKSITANAYLGGWGIAEALAAEADVVVCPRVTDASLVVGPAAWWHGWARDDWDALAGAVVAGHVVECGPQATGGNYSFLDEITDRRYPGFPVAEVAADGSSVITKHDGTGG